MTTQIATTWVFITIGVFIAYHIIATVLLYLSEGGRIELSKLSKELLAREDIEEKYKDYISKTLDDIFSWQFIALLTWFLATTPMKNRNANDEFRHFLSDQEVNRFFTLQLLVTLAACPIWAIIFSIVFILRETVLILNSVFSRSKTRLIETVVVDTRKAGVYTIAYKNIRVSNGIAG